VAYDEKRGEPRMKVKDRVLGVLAGDCIACRACVNACPTGTDIKRGLQPECIGTAQCIDACDEVMRGIASRSDSSSTPLSASRRAAVRRIWRPRSIAYSRS